MKLTFRTVILIQLILINAKSLAIEPTDDECIFIGCDCDFEDEEDRSVECTYQNYFPERYYSKVGNSKFERIVMTENSFKKVPAYAFKNLYISMLELKNNKIDEIDKLAFSSIGKIDHLDLSENEIYLINEGMFRPLKRRLTQLFLNKNKLHKMKTSDLSRALAELNQLTILKLSNNNITELPNLSPLVNLKELFLSNNFIVNLNVNKLLPSSLTSLDLDNNLATQIDDKAFEKLIQLKVLKLNSNRITSLNENSFHGLKQLAQLELAKNLIKHIPPKLFYSLVSLDRLDLSDQKNHLLKEIGDYWFQRESNDVPIRKIDLSNNGIAKMRNKAFCDKSSVPYARIERIDLSNNPLGKIDSCILSQLAKGFEQKNVNTFRPLVQLTKESKSLKEEKRTLKCDCSMTKLSLYVELRGECQKDGINLQLNNFKCSTNDLDAEILCKQDFCLQQDEPRGELNYDFEQDYDNQIDQHTVLHTTTLKPNEMSTTSTTSTSVTHSSSTQSTYTTFATTASTHTPTTIDTSTQSYSTQLPPTTTGTSTPSSSTQLPQTTTAKETSTHTSYYTQLPPSTTAIETGTQGSYTQLPSTTTTIDATTQSTVTQSTSTPLETTKSIYTTQSPYTTLETTRQSSVTQLSPTTPALTQVNQSSVVEQKNKTSDKTQSADGKSSTNGSSKYSFSLNLHFCKVYFLLFFTISTYFFYYSHHTLLV